MTLVAQPYDADGLAVQVEHIALPGEQYATYDHQNQQHVAYEQEGVPVDYNHHPTPAPVDHYEQNKHNHEFESQGHQGGLSTQPSMTPSEIDSTYAATERSFLKSSCGTIHPPIDMAAAQNDVAALAAVLAPNTNVTISHEQQMTFLSRFVETYEAYTHAPNIDAAFAGDNIRSAYRALSMRLTSALGENEPDFLRVLLSTLRILTRSDGANTELTKCNVPKLLAKALLKCMDDASAVYHASSAIGNMSRTPLAQQALKAADAWPAVLKALQLHKNDVGVVRGAMLGLEKLTNEFPRKLGRDTVTEVLSIMQVYIGDPQIQASGCGALWKYSIGSFILNNNKKFLGDVVAVPAVLSALNVHPNDPRVAWKGLGALSSFCSHGLNRAIFRHYEGDKYVKRVIEVHAGVKDIQVMGRRVLSRIASTTPAPEGAGIDWKILPNAIASSAYVTGSRERLYPSPKGAPPMSVGL